MLTLQDLLDAFAEGGEAAVHALLQAEGFTHAAAEALRGEAADAFQSLYTNPDRTSADVAQMSVLADAVDLLKGAESWFAGLTEAATAEAEALAARINPAPAADAPAAAETPAEVPAEVPAELVAAAPAQRPRVRLADIARRAPQATPPAVIEQDGTPVRSGATLVAAADVPGFPTGVTLDLDGAAQALLARSATLPTSQIEGAHIRHQFALVRKPESAFVANGVNDMDVLDAASDEARLPGGSLVAAGGWCAPSETWYDLCPGLESGAGMLSLPTVMATRGGVRWTQGPQFCDFYSGTGFFDMTEAQDIAGFTKPCFEIPCPEFEEARIDAHGLCLTAGILQNKGYPEYVSRFIAGTLMAHAHRINAIKIRELEALIAAQHDVTVPVNASTGALNSVLDALELQIETYRYRYRMDPNRSLEMVAPLWLRGIIRSDISKRNGVPQETISDGEINAFFATRGAAVQWVYDWQDALCQATATEGTPVSGGDFGRSQETAAWPDEVSVLLYPAGSFLALEQDIITLENVYDSTLFRQNRYTALFTEEAFKVINRCYDGVKLTIPVCPSGTMTADSAPVCPAPAHTATP